jgi:CCR4-NOT transcription complex subunit 2
MIVSRPVQQIMQSPVDRWGLKQLLYEIKMAKGDMSSLIFGEDLGEFGVDVAQDE